MSVFITDKDGKLKKVAGNFVPKESPNLDCLRTELLWTNPNPTSEFSAQTITLKSNDYDFLLIFYYSNTVDKIVSSTVCEKGNRFELSRAVAYASGYYTLNANRNCDIVSDTQYSVGNASTAFVNASGSSERISVNNGDLIPVSIYGLKKSPAMIYTGAELHEGNGISIENGVISAERKYVTLSLSSILTKNWNTITEVAFNVTDNQATEYFSVSGGQITVLKNCKIRATGNVRASGTLGTTNRFIVATTTSFEICGQQNARSSQVNSAYELLSATSPIMSISAGQIIHLMYQNTYNGNSDVGRQYTNLCVEVID